MVYERSQCFITHRASLLPFEYFVGFPRGCETKYVRFSCARTDTRTWTGISNELEIDGRDRERARECARYKSISLRLFYVPLTHTHSHTENSAQHSETHSLTHSFIRLACMRYFGNDAIRMRYELNIIDTAPLESNDPAFAATASTMYGVRSHIPIPFLSAAFGSHRLIYASHNTACGAAHPTNG